MWNRTWQMNWSVECARRTLRHSALSSKLTHDAAAAALKPVLRRHGSNYRLIQADVGEVKVSGGRRRREPSISVVVVKQVQFCSGGTLMEVFGPFLGGWLHIYWTCPCWLCQVI